MFDCALRYGALAKTRSQILASLKLEDKGFVLCTAHRAENTDDAVCLSNLFEALALLAQTRPVVLPLHPRTRALAERAGVGIGHEGLIITEPLGYLDMVRLEQAASLIITDSGGVQKEAFFHQVPCLTIRSETEWVELVDSGWNRLCPLMLGAEAVAEAALAQSEVIGKSVQPYGRGDAAVQIVSALSD